jgi:hypothetical protein
MCKKDIEYRIGDIHRESRSQYFGPLPRQFDGDFTVQDDEHELIFAYPRSAQGFVLNWSTDDS